MIEYLDGLGESASIMGAVNCVVRRDDALIGENTDGKGFLESLATVTSPRGKRVVLFGAGHAARAIGVELALANAAKILVVNRDPARGEALAWLVAGAGDGRSRCNPQPAADRALAGSRCQGGTTLDGLGMLVNQGVLGIRFWTGVDVDPSVMRQSLKTIFRSP